MSLPTVFVFGPEHVVVRPAERFVCAPAPQGRGRAARPVRWLTRVAACLAAMTGTAATPQPGTLLPAAPAGMIESGVPAFSVTSIDSIGLTSRPTDLGVLPDGRMVLVAANRIAFGDGSEWQVFSPSTHHDGSGLQLDLVVGSDGGLYNGTIGGVRRIELQTDGRWLVRTVAMLPDSDPNRHLPMLRAFQSGDRWLWLNSEGAIYEWRPGQDLRPIGGLSHVEFLVEFDGRLIMMQKGKGLVEYRDGAATAVPAFASLNRPELAVRAVLQIGPRELLIGTQTNGLHLYDGTEVRAFRLSGGTVELRQVQDLCRINDNLFAAAAGTEGIVFFDREGRIVQVLDRSLDHRLGAVRRIRYVNGVVWALLHDGIARVEFPSQFSDFTPLSPTTLNFSRPFRHQGHLWLLTDGLTMRAEYSSIGRLERMVVDTPAEAYTWSLASIDELFLACGDSRIHQYTKAGWTPILDNATNARIEARAPDGRWLYTAKGEIGWVSIHEGRARFERHPLPGLENTYGLVQDAHDVAWIELGVGLVGRVDLSRPGPAMDTFGPEDGLPSSWVQICLLDGEAVFAIADNLFRFEPTSRRFVPHTELAARFTERRQALGRFAVDALGRLWVTARERIFIHAESSGADERPLPRVPEAIQSAASAFAMEDGGVVWIQAPQRLLRYDPGLPAAVLPPVQPIITHVRFPTTGTIEFSPRRELSLEFVDNSLEFHFAAPRNPFQQQVSYEVRVDGLSDTWTPVESAPLAAYNHLHEGSYRFRVRALVDGKPDGEASLPFVVEPPPYRTTAAYVAYAGSALGLLVAVAGLVTWINRRERGRLAALVASRTTELQASQDQLRRAVESGSVGVWDYDLTTGRMTWNRQCQLIYGLQEDVSTITRERFRTLAHPDDREAVTRAYSVAIEKRSELRIEHRILRPDGTVRWVTAFGRAIYDDTGAATAIQGAALDITERREADDELRDREYLQRQMIESSPVAMLMVDRQERVLYGNATFTRLFGYGTSEVPKIDAWWPLAYPDPEYRELIRGEWMRRMQHAAEMHQPLDPMEAIVTCKGGTRRAIQFATSEVGDRTLVVFTDLTERKLAEQAIRDMNTTLERRVKERTAEIEAANRELESFSYSVSHDLRGPLRGIDGWSLALMEDYGASLDQTALGYLVRVRTETQRLGQLIDDLLKLSRTTRAEFRPERVNLSELVESTAHRVVGTRPDSRVQLVCQPGLTTHGDPGLLEAALFNLLDNAWKFSSKVAEPRVDFGLTETLSGPAFYIRDNGAGFDMRHARKLFGVFQRMHDQSEFPGTGVGLATVQRIVHRHGGRIWADSVPGEHTTFYFQLPGIDDAVSTTGSRPHS